MQYLFSKTGKLIEKVEESSVYLVKISLKNEAFDKFILRLPPSIKSCWIYGVFVEKKTTPVIKPNFNQHFDVESINSLLSNSSHLSSNAEKFKSLFDNFQGTGASSMSMPTAPILNPSTSNLNSSGDSDSPNFQFLKFYIDSKFQQLEEKLIRIIEEKDKVQNDKLDIMIKLLESKSSQ